MMARRAYGLFLVLLPFAFIFGFGSGSAAPAGRGADVRRGPDPALVGWLDDVIQKRFSELTIEDYRSARFGAARIIPLVVAHSLKVELEEPWASLPLGRLSESGWRTALFVAENRVGKRVRGERWLDGPISPEDDRWDYSPDRVPLKALADRVVEERGAVRGEDGSVILEGRPLLASRLECLKCHPGNRLGEPIGAVIYAFAPKAGGAR